MPTRPFKNKSYTERNASLAIKTRSRENRKKHFCDFSTRLVYGLSFDKHCIAGVNNLVFVRISVTSVAVKNFFLPYLINEAMFFAEQNYPQRPQQERLQTPSTTGYERAEIDASRLGDISEYLKTFVYRSLLAKTEIARGERSPLSET